jgi:hydrogenase/urease accessory protein HupE
MSDAEGFWEFLSARKKVWLTPLVMLAVIAVGLYFLLQGATIPHFSYRLY